MFYLSVLKFLFFIVYIETNMYQGFAFSIVFSASGLVKYSNSAKYVITWGKEEGGSWDKY